MQCKRQKRGESTNKQNNHHPLCFLRERKKCFPLSLRKTFWPSRSGRLRMQSTCTMYSVRMMVIDCVCPTWPEDVLVCIKKLSLSGVSFLLRSSVPFLVGQSTYFTSLFFSLFFRATQLSLRHLLFLWTKAEKGVRMEGRIFSQSIRLQSPLFTFASIWTVGWVVGWGFLQRTPFIATSTHYWRWGKDKQVPITVYLVGRPPRASHFWVLLEKTGLIKRRVLLTDVNCNRSPSNEWNVYVQYIASRKRYMESKRERKGAKKLELQKFRAKETTDRHSKLRKPNQLLSLSLFLRQQRTGRLY